MYTQEDYRKLQAQIHKRFWLMLLPALVLLGLIVWSFVVRIKWLTMGLTIFLGALLIFFNGLFIAPLTAYKRHLEDALMGRTRQIKGAFKEMEEASVLRDGVVYYPMLISVGDPEDPEDDRLFYYDANLNRPAFSQGDMLVITAHDKFVTAWARA